MTATGKHTGALSLLIAALCICMLAPSHPACSQTLPDGVVRLDTTKVGRSDSGYPTIAATLHGGFLWIGREQGFRRYDRDTLEWEFTVYEGGICSGHGTINVVADPPYMWFRLTNTGTLCRYDISDGSWYSPKHWTVLEHTGEAEFGRGDGRIERQGRPRERTGAERRHIHATTCVVEALDISCERPPMARRWCERATG